MNNLKTKIVFVLLVSMMLLSIQAISAESSDDADLAINNDIDSNLEINQDDSNQLQATDDNEVLSAGSGNFTELQGQINAVDDGSILVLDKNYTMVSGENPISITKAITVDGQGHTLNAGGLNIIFNVGSKVTLKNIIFTNASNRGSVYGAVYLNTGSDGSTIDNCTFKDNKGSQAAAIYWRSDNGTLINSKFINNTVDSTGSTSSNGGAIYWYGANGTVTSSDFTNNSAKTFGGAIYWRGADGEVISSNFTSNSAKGSGGAIYFDSGTVNASVRKSTFSKNKAEGSQSSQGGAIYFYDANATVIGSNFTNNSAASSGGAVYYGLNSKNHLINDSYFAENNARYGGAVYIGGDENIIDNTKFIDNSAVSSGGAVYYDCDNHSISNSVFSGNVANEYNGGAIYCVSGNGSMVNTNFTKNSAERSGGAIFWSAEKSSLNGCNFISNEANNGGAIYYAAGSNVTIVDSNFSKNNAEMAAGAIYAIDSELIMDNSIFNENSALSGGGAIYLLDDNFVNITNSKFHKNTLPISDYEAGEGGAIYSDSSNFYIDNCEFADNVAYNGGAIGTDEQDDGPVVNKVTNSNFTENTAATFGGAVYSESNKFIIDNCLFERNNGNYAGAVSSTGFTASMSILNSDFIENSATSQGGAVSMNGFDSIIDSSTFVNNSAANGGALYATYSRNLIVNDSQFIENEANNAGAIFASGCNKFTVSNSNFTKNSAGAYAGAAYISGPDNSIVNSNFTENSAKNAGAVYLAGPSYNFVVNNTIFKNNNASANAGALMLNANSTAVDNSVFMGNNASAASAIFNARGALTVSNTELFENQANANNLTVNATVNGFEVTLNTVFKGWDNLLNGIYSNNLDVTLINVDYWGFNEKMNTGSDPVKPVSSADSSNNGELVYRDIREAGINITVSIYDENDNLVLNITKMTNIYGDVNASGITLVPGKYKVKAIHKEDKYYTEILAESEFEILKANSTISAENVTVVYPSDVVLVASGENATGIEDSIVILDAEGNVVDAELRINGFNITIKNLAVGNYTVYYNNTVNSTHYNQASNHTKVTVLPANSTVSAENLTFTYGDVIEIPVTSVNATNVTYVVFDEDGNKVAEGNLSVGDAITGLNLAVGNYTVNLTANVDCNHTGSVNISKITVNPANSTVSAENLTFTYGDVIVVPVASENATSVNYTVFDENGKELFNGTIGVGESITGLNLPAGNYTVNLTANVDENHTSSEYVSKITVKPAASTVSAEDITVNYGDDIVIPVTSQNATNVTYSIIDKDGNKIVNGTLAVGENITNLDLPAGDYTVSLTTGVDENHTIATNSSKLHIKHVITVILEPVIGYTGEVKDFIAHVTDETGALVEGGKVVLTIIYSDGTPLGASSTESILGAGDETYSTSVSGGKALFKDIVLKDPGVYPSRAVYSAEGVDDAENESTVTVLKLNTTVEGDDVSGKPGDKKDIDVKILDQNGKPVKNGTATLKVDGKSYTADVVNGVATFKDVVLPSSNTVAEVYYHGNEYYNDSNSTLNIIIVKEPKKDPDNNDSNKTGGNDTKDISSKVVDSRATGNPFALLVLALIALVSNRIYRNKK